MHVHIHLWRTAILSVIFFIRIMTTLTTKVTARGKFPCEWFCFIWHQFHNIQKGLNSWVWSWCSIFTWWISVCGWCWSGSSCMFVCLFFIIRIGAKHQELRQKQLRGLLDYSTGPGGPDIDDDEVDPNYARVNHFREAYPAASIYRPSSPAVAETFVYPRDSSSTPMEREHLEGLYAKINKQHYPQVPGDR